MRTIKNLLTKKGRVYVYLPDEEIARQFLVDAEREGFTFGDGASVTKREPSDIYALNEDKTINFVGFAGHILFNSAKKIGKSKLFKVNYRKYREGIKEYLM